MKSHRFDSTSFLFGTVFTTIAVLAAIEGSALSLDDWVLPASILFLGIGLLLVTLRGLSQDAEATPSADEDQ